jgi:IMP dehydrogenase/GMP reductase
MLIENDIKLDFDDVLIKPKRSSIVSRKDVNISRTFKFKHSGKSWTGVPIMAANMATTGTFNIANELVKHGMMTVLHKFNTIDDWRNQTEKFGIEYDNMIQSIGTGPDDLEKFNSLCVYFMVKHNRKPSFVCIDVANGYTESFISFVKSFRSKNPEITIIAGNVCTREMTEELILAGVDIVKCGIGPGCFKGDTRILMANGAYKDICDVEIDDYVINKDGKPVKVINKWNKGNRNVMKIRTNNWHDKTYVTPDHNYWIGDLSTSSDYSIKSSGKAKLLDKLSKTIPKQSKYKWKSLDNIDTRKNLLLMPKNIEWQLDENFTIDLAQYCNRGQICDDHIITKNQYTTKFNRYISSGYELGYIFGTFLGDGHSYISTYQNSERSSCNWSFGAHETNIAEKLSKCIETVLNYKCTISKKNNNMLIVYCCNKSLTKMLYQFLKRTEKHLPEQYYCKNIEYIQGLYDGLIDSDGYTDFCTNNNKIDSLANTSKYILEVFYWCCINLKISFSTMKCKKSIGNLKGTSIENLQDSFRIKTHTFNRFTKDYVYSEIFEKENNNQTETVWDIKVDCPTHSFIANNSIVHNSNCTTRVQTGVGYPQLSAVIECADAAHGLGAHIIADGGCRVTSDIVKAFSAGADFVMAGGMFAGYAESGGEEIIENYRSNKIDETFEPIYITKKFKLNYGMSSYHAQKVHGDGNGIKEYRSSEGRVTKVPFKENLQLDLQNMLGSIKSACSYVGANELKQLSKCTTFIRVNKTHNTSMEKHDVSDEYR